MYERQSVAEALQALEANDATGLGTEEAEARLARWGTNTFTEKKQKNIFQKFIDQLRDPLIYILLAAVAISVFLKEYSDAAIIMAIVLLNAIIGVVQEAKAEKSLEALKKMASPLALVRRDGSPVEIPASQLVPGDIVILEAGRIVPADLRLISAVNLKIEESALTGESVPVQKDASFVAEGELTLGDRINMSYMSTHVAYGRGEGVVAATGMGTEIGRIAQMINESVDGLTPLQKRLAELGKLLGFIAMALCAGLFILALIQGRDVVEMFLTAISLAVAAVPEGLPAVVTIVLALGVQRMVRVNTIVRKLPAVETLGSVSVVCSDKTGTLTQNKMTVTRVYLEGQVQAASELSYERDHLFLNGLVLCTDASVCGDRRIGDPTELALLDLGLKFGADKCILESSHPRINEQAFDSERKMMTTVHRDAVTEEVIAFTKGATDRVLPLCSHIRIGGEDHPIDKNGILAIEAAAGEMARQALRVLALAIRMEDESAREGDLTFVGLVGMIDPPRPEAAEAVQVFDKASIRTIMITGDHKDTALAIARELGIASDESECLTGEELSRMDQEELNRRAPEIRVFARVSPEHKVMIVNAFKSHGHIVSMTGDGVNDAPSLKIADIGVAMGMVGTDVAKGAADMVLTDDNFATIQKAIEEGRNIYGNIRKSVLFLLSSNLGEIVTMFVAIALGLAAPLKAIHILWVNLITDSLPALALGVDPGHRDIMQGPPRNPRESLFARGGLAFMIVFGTVIGAITLTAFLFPPIQALMEAGEAVNLGTIAMALEDPMKLVHAQTYAFTVLGISQLFNAMGVRNLERSIFTYNHLNNPMMILAFAVGFSLQIAVTEVPVLTEIFGTTALTLQEWILLTALSATPLVVHEVFVLARRIRIRPGRG